MDRQEMGAFLRACRGRTDPVSSGFAVGKRRRVAGLRREEVAELAGISPDWYTRLEQGRDVGVSRDVLERLIDAFQLTASEADYLISLSGISPATQTEQRPAPGGTEQVAQQRVLESLNPHPAYYVAGPWDLVAWNESAEQVMPELFRTDARRNALRMVFCNESFRERLADWEQHARHCMAVFRGDYGRHPGDERFRRVAAELTIASPEFARWWPEHQVEVRTPAEKQLHDPELGELHFVTQFFHATERSDLVLIVFCGDASTQRRIAGRLDEGSAPDRAAPIHQLPGSGL
ncbi:helix-turn-helix transcriptional regulator [Aquisalimonas lutea]|uniref:helix-turn-helix transcriptional regulator n=1 Tax=Aquisalimonas lutea TaxID=1327750 RepID=UPI0025B3DD26|nr:helix-turn-helix transcriptional regulator [Aquisalimonas lutea]MDN3516578.1 helix-turn-helix transcriptional regulator [Aquisalimonas lutea]